MSNEIAPALDILEELKQECEAINKVQTELYTALVEQVSNPKANSIKAQETIQTHLLRETQTRIKEHQLFVLATLSESSEKFDPKFEALQQLIKEQQESIELRDYSLFASVQLVERILLSLVYGLVMVGCWSSGTKVNKPQTTSDYDLRYRYLRMRDKVTKKDFDYLDGILITHRNPKVIQQIQQKVIDYEQAMQR